MPAPHWRDRLTSELRRHGLPSAYIDRLVDELADHSADLFTEDQRMDATQTEPEIESRLGTAEQLAAAAVTEYRQRTFAGRHPVLTFIFGPIFAALLTLVTIMLLLIGIGWLLNALDGGSLESNGLSNEPPTSFQLGLMHTVNFVVRFVPFAISAWFFFRMGRRCGLPKWSLVACTIVAVTAVFFSSVISQTTADGHGMWTIGFGTSIGLDQFIQALVPLALGARLLWQSSIRPRWIGS